MTAREPDATAAAGVQQASLGQLLRRMLPLLAPQRGAGLARARR